MLRLCNLEKWYLPNVVEYSGLIIETNDSWIYDKNYSTFFFLYTNNFHDMSYLYEYEYRDKIARACVHNYVNRGICLPMFCYHQNNQNKKIINNFKSRSFFEIELHVIMIKNYHLAIFEVIWRSHEENRKHFIIILSIFSLLVLLDHY